MPSQVTNYKCPACTGPLHFSGDSGKLECEYCGSCYDVEEIEALFAEKEAAAARVSDEAEEKAAESDEESSWDFSDINSDWGEDGVKMKAYSCPSCGAELICDETTAATSCPYCGNPTVIPGQFSGMLKPDYVIPFKLGKADAITTLKKHYRGKIFLPKTFADGNHLEEIKGIYVPFWLFDGVVDGNIAYQGTRSHTHTEGDEEVTITDHYRMDRAGIVPFERIPADASSKMPDEHMDSIEPFDYSELKPFSTAYLPGFLADKYDVSAQDSEERANKRVKTSTEVAFAGTVNGYTTVNVEQSNIQLSDGSTKYALYPVWLLNTTWNGQKYVFAMNGQTGRFVGDLPVDKAAARKWTLGLTALFGVITYGLAWLIHLL